MMKGVKRAGWDNAFLTFGAVRQRSYANPHLLAIGQTRELDAEE